MRMSPLSSVYLVYGISMVGSAAPAFAGLAAAATPAYEKAIRNTQADRRRVFMGFPGNRLANGIAREAHGSRATIKRVGGTPGRIRCLGTAAGSTALRRRTARHPWRRCARVRH